MPDGSAALAGSVLHRPSVPSVTLTPRRVGGSIAASGAASARAAAGAGAAARLAPVGAGGGRGREDPFGISAPWPISGSSDGWSLPEKSLGQFAELNPGYAAYRPARMGLRSALESGTIRDPLRMTQNAAPWSARSGRESPAHPGGAGDNRPGSSHGMAPSSSSTAPTPTPRQQANRDRTIAPTGGVPSGGDLGAMDDVQLLQPQRIELPGYLNTPVRRSDGVPVDADERAAALRRIQDLELLVYACRRAAKAREEGRAHFALGVLRDNLAQYSKAIESYNNFLKVCTTCRDTLGCALAYHCIGVNYQLLGMGIGAKSTSGGAGADAPSPSAAPSPAVETMATVVTPIPEEPPAVQPSPSSAVKPQLLRKAITFHNKHRELTDTVGKFVAHLNMGLAYASLGEKEASTVNHQYALRYAMELNSLEGQSLAVASLSFGSGMQENDPERMKALVERYMQLCGALKRTKHKAQAFSKLGVIASQQGDNSSSVGFFKQAMDKAREHKSQRLEAECSVRLGIAAGQAKMAEHLSNVLERCLAGGAGSAPEPEGLDEG